MQVITLSLFLLLLSCSQSGRVVPGRHHASLPARQPAQLPAIPTALLAFLQRDLPDWQLVNESDYDRSFWSLYTGDHLPFLVSADVNDDGLTDHCVLLKIAGYVKPFFLLGREEEGFTILRQDAFRIPFDDSNNDLQYSLSVEAPGQIDVAIPEIRSLQLRTIGVNFMELENRWCIFHWDLSSISAFVCR